VAQTSKQIIVFAIAYSFSINSNLSLNTRTPVLFTHLQVFLKLWLLFSRLPANLHYLPF